MYTKSTVINHLSTFFFSHPWTYSRYWTVSFWRVRISDSQIWRQQEAELHKASSSLVPSPFWCQPGNTTHLAGLKNWQPRWGWSPAHLAHAGSLAQKTEEPAAAALQVWHTSCGCPAPTGLQGKAAADSEAPGPNTSAVKHHPAANKLRSVPLTSGFHLCLCMKKALVSCAHVYKVSFLAK